MVMIIYHSPNRVIIMDYKVQHHIQQEPDHLNIHWDMLTICQLNCSYCYARNDYGRDWGKISNKTIIDAVLTALNRSKLNFNLGLLGGEPTIGPYYKYVLEQIANFKKNIGIYVTTNGVRDLTNDNTPTNTAFLFSYHVADCKDINVFLKNVQYMKDNNYKCKVNIILNPNKKYWPQLKEMFNIIKDIGVKSHPHFLYGNWDRKLYNYNESFWEFFSFLGNMKKELCYDTDLYNDYEVYKNNLTNFQGWKCWNNNYEIDVYGNVVQFCKDKNIHVNLLRHQDYFNNIEKTEPMICPHDECNCDGLLKLLKVK